MVNLHFYFTSYLFVPNTADVVMGVMANIFYLEKGYKISEIATYSKFFGVFATIIGGFIGGYCSINLEL